MFQEIFKFSYQRNGLQAVGWYIVILVILLLVIAIFSALFGFGGPTNNWNEFISGMRFGVRIAVVAVLILGILLIKDRPKNVKNVLLLLGAAAITAFLGAVLGLIPLAVLTTCPLSNSTQT